MMKTQKSSSEVSKSGTTIYDLIEGRRPCDGCGTAPSDVKDSGILYCADCWIKEHKETGF
jgi:hypothetical protein